MKAIYRVNTRLRGTIVSNFSPRYYDAPIELSSEQGFYDGQLVQVTVEALEDSQDAPK